MLASNKSTRQNKPNNWWIFDLINWFRVESRNIEGYCMSKLKEKSKPKPRPKSKGNNNNKEEDVGILELLHGNIQYINDSKFFAGIVIISLNIASKFVNIRLSKTSETYLKYTFSWQILIFAMAWMATRDIYTALILTIFFIILTQFLFNETSRFCIYSDNFKEYYSNAAAAASSSSSSGPGAGAGPGNTTESLTIINNAIDALEKMKSSIDSTSTSSASSSGSAAASSIIQQMER